MGTWKMQRVNNKEESRKQQEALRQKERDQYYSNKVYLSPLANAEGTYTEALKAYEKAVSERVFYEKKRRDVLIRLQKHPETKVRRAAKNQKGGMDVDSVNKANFGQARLGWFINVIEAMCIGNARSVTMGKRLA